MIIGVVVGVVIIAMANALPSRMPPDPFEGNEPREVLFEVVWAGNQRTQVIAWESPEDSGDIRAIGERFSDNSGWFWNHSTIAFDGDPLVLSAVQMARGPVECAIYVDGGRVGVDEDMEKSGCFVETVVR